MIRVDTTDLLRLNRSLRELAKAELAELTAGLAKLSVEQTQRRFDAREDPSGERWEPRKDTRPHPLLEETGRMRRSIRDREVQEYEAEIGTTGSVPYARAHQYGFPPTNLPPRVYLGWGDEDHEELADETDEWLETYVGKVLR